VLDEIDSGMDVDGVRAVVQLVQDLRAQGTAFIVVSHYLQMIESLEPDAVLRLDQGCIAETGGMAWPATSPAPASCAARTAGGLSMDSARADILAARHLHTRGWIAAAALSPPAAADAAVWLGDSPGKRRRLRRPPLAGAGWTLHPIGHSPQGRRCPLARRADPAQRACLPACPRPATTTPPPLPGPTAPVPPGPAPAHAGHARQGAREQDIVWLHLRHQPRAQPRRRCWCSTWTRACAAC
jgi:hypothetical protein